MRLRIWTWHYAPEPMGIGPVAAAVAGALRDRSHEIDVIAAHPHYPASAEWPRRLLPTDDTFAGIQVRRLVLWPGRSPRRRIGQELTYAASVTAEALTRWRPVDASIVVTPPLFPTAPIALAHAAHRTPWVLWLQDMLTDAAQTTGLVRNRLVLRGARRVEAAAYARASRIVAISSIFEQRLEATGVSRKRIVRIPNPSTRPAAPRRKQEGTPYILSMGNVGLSQGLVEVVEAFQASRGAARAARLLITGDGQEMDRLRDTVRSPRVEVLGVVSEARLTDLLAGAALGLVSQRPGLTEFNFPSKLVNFMACGVPILAVVHPQSEVAHTMREAGAGWLVDSRTPQDLEHAVAEALSDHEELAARGRAGRTYAQARFTTDHVAARFEEVLAAAIAEGKAPRSE